MYSNLKVSLFFELQSFVTPEGSQGIDTDLNI